MRPERAFRWVIVAVAVLAAACGQSGPTKGVKVQAVSTDIGLGAKLVDPSAAAASPIVYNDQNGGGDIAPPEYVPLKQVHTVKSVGAQDACPQPADFTYADSAPDTLTGRPDPGAYLWRQTGTVSNGKQTASYPALGNRVITDVQGDGNIKDAFYYTMTEIESLTHAQIITRFHVIPHTVNVTDQAGGVNAPEDVRNNGYVVTPGESQLIVRAPETGVFLTSRVINSFTPDGKVSQARFTPEPEVQLISFRSDPGVPIDSTGVDPTTQDELHTQGVIKPQKQLDACGDVYNAILVQGTQTVTQTVTPAGATAPKRVSVTYGYDYAFATQSGGMFVYEKISLPKDKPAYVKETNAGSLKHVSA